MSPWLPASIVVPSGARRWLDDYGSGLPPGGEGTVLWWDGQQAQQGIVVGWWDGQQAQPATVVGWWDGQQVQPVTG